MVSSSTGDRMESIARKFAFYIARQENHSADFFQARNRANGLYIGSRIETDPAFEDNLKYMIRPRDIVEASRSSSQLTKLEQRFAGWIQSHSTNKIQGLENFEADYSEGTTQAFDSFYFRHRTRRFRCFVGEYFYHIKTWQSNSVDWDWTDGKDLEPGDALVLSQPFCDTASQFKNLNEILENCTRLKIPVLLDLCYYVISEGLDIDVNHSCIDTVCFSTSKAWPISTARIGMRYTRPGTFDGQKLHSSIGYNNNLGAYIGNLVLDNYGPDWISTTRKTQYQTICHVLNLTPTNSVCFGLGDETWTRYSRQALLSSYKLDYDPKLFVNRICLNKIYQHWDLFVEFLNHEYQIKI